MCSSPAIGEHARHEEATSFTSPTPRAARSRNVVETG